MYCNCFWYLTEAGTNLVVDRSAPSCTSANIGSFLSLSSTSPGVYRVSDLCYIKSFHIASSCLIQSSRSRRYSSFAILITYMTMAYELIFEISGSCFDFSHNFFIMSLQMLISPGHKFRDLPFPKQVLRLERTSLSFMNEFGF